MKTKQEVKGQRLDVTLAEAKEERRGLKAFDKKSVLLHSKDAAADGAGLPSGTTASPAPPTDEELAAINEYTRTPKTADQLVVLPTLSCNTMQDRDDDVFTARTIQDFKDAPAPYGPNGKSYMVGHDYSKLPMGRIFDTDTAEAEGTTWLTNKVYIPNTPSNQPFIESVDFGVNWAVSVGVMIEQTLCSIDNSPMSSFWGMGVCQEGHFKSAKYDPNETRTDDWGYIIEAADGDKSAVKALMQMDGGKDFYELSQVFLGAQYFAALESSKGADGSFIKSAFTAAKKGKLPILGLSAKEADDLPLNHADPKVVDALARYEVKHLDDGALKWTDSEGLIWTCEPGADVLCLGKEAKGETDEEVDDNGQEADGEEGRAGEGSHADPESGSLGDGSGDDGGSEEQEDHADQDQLGSGGDLTEDASAAEVAEGSDTGAVQETAKASVIAAAKRAGVSGDLMAVIAEATGNGIEEVLRTASVQISVLEKQVAQLSPEAELGKQYMKELRAEAIDWYVRAQALNGQQGVNTTAFEKILDAATVTVDMVKELIEEQKTLAKRNASPARRSTFDTDPTPRFNAEADNPGERSRKAVRRLHG